MLATALCLRLSNDAARESRCGLRAGCHLPLRAMFVSSIASDGPALAMKTAADSSSDDRLRQHAEHRWGSTQRADVKALRLLSASYLPGLERLAILLLEMRPSFDAPSVLRVQRLLIDTERFFA